MKRMKRFFGQQSRSLRSTCAVVSTVALMGFAAPVVHADLPAQQQVQVPGYFRMPLGQFEVTALYDGAVFIKPALFAGADRKVIDATLQKSFQPASEPIQTAINTYLVHTNKNLILVDTGGARLVPMYGNTVGFLLANLRAAGYQPEQVDTILLTHMHLDHVGGLLSPTGEILFPNARILAPKADADYWLSEEMEKSAPKERQPMFKMVRETLEPYIAAGRFTVFNPGDALPEGVTAKSAPGHTPGHTAYLFSSQGQELLIWGDVVHNVNLQFAHPEVGIEFDTDKKMAVETRRNLLAETGSGKGRPWVAGAHIPFPGIGRVHATEVNNKVSDYNWVPVEYKPFPARH